MNVIDDLSSDSADDRALNRLSASAERFRKREEAATRGDHLPTSFELLEGMEFHLGSVHEDAQVFAERLSGRLKRLGCRSQIEDLIDGVDQLAIDLIDAPAVRAVDELLLKYADLLSKRFVLWRLRVRIYAAALGDVQAMFDTARDAGAMAAMRSSSVARLDSVYRLVGQSLGWIGSAASVDPAYHCLSGPVPFRYGREPDAVASIYARDILGALESRNRVLAKGNANNPGSRSEQEPIDQAASLEVEQVGGPGVVVFTALGNAMTDEGRKVKSSFRPFLHVPLKLAETPDLQLVRDALRSEFPFAEREISALLSGLDNLEHVHIRPTILVGAPGSGKTRFGRMFLSRLELPFEMVGAAAADDGSIAGTPRRWSSGEPCLPVATIARFKHGGPGILIDEIDKAGTGRRNGNLLDAMLPFLERETASRFRDPYLEAPCDLSHVSWVMTANELEVIPQVLRDRCRVVFWPTPTVEHLPSISKRIITEIALEDSHDIRFASSLDEAELAAVASVWPGGSLRKLKRVIEVVLRARHGRH
ncbi:hypothetical protein GCM10007301_51850 [Azorhizobium oxalatiphilum]|uniref:ATPase AAA-type core domain-containing protein n=1 Tax=Azorhizobium oxalatiphilum TaxID=980631 RepID=A0A917CDM3_9HYPH|nr:AAA family ATPase [Azorhizobium oxalatiphilum]GGF85576.1 hypothetical protein GCM10007301_51850 [Azorhizobium oxalatiphilum]